MGTNIVPATFSMKDKLPVLTFEAITTAIKTINVIIIPTRPALLFIK